MSLKIYNLRNNLLINDIYSNKKSNVNNQQLIDQNNNDIVGDNVSFFNNHLNSFSEVYRGCVAPHNR